VVTGVVALAGVVASLAVALSGSGAGAESPEDAVRQFAAAVSDEDVVGALTMLPPSEVGSVHELYEPLVKLLVKTGELGPDGEPLAGVDIEITDLELETLDLAGGIGKVYVRGGKVTVDVTAAEADPVLREQGMIEDSHEEFDFATDGQQVIDDANGTLGSGFGEITGGFAATGELSGIFLMTVEEGGRWYVSPTYSLAEYAREALGLPEPQFGAWRDDVGPGAGSPSEVVESFASALSGVDAEALRQAIESGNPLELDMKGELAPGEFAALFDYAPSFEQWTEDLFGAGFSGGANELADILEDIEFDMTVDVDVEEQPVADDRVKVVVRDATFELHAAGVIDGESGTVDLRADIRDGLCLDVTGQAVVDGEVESLDESTCAYDLLPGGDFDGFFLVTVERGGSWYFSAVETLVEYARVAIDSELAR
jgi:hypothetical protein